METLGRSKSPKFTCYFCQKVIANETEIGHTTVCSKVLIPCPNKCGSYIARASLHKHQNECVNQRRSPIYIKSNNNLTATSAVVHHQPDAYKTGSLDRNGASHRVHLQEEILRLSKKVSQLELQQTLNKRPQQESNNLPIKGILDRLEDTRNNVNQHSLLIEKINYHNNFVQDWKRNFETQLETIKANSKLLENIAKNTDLKWQQMQEHILGLEKIVMDYNCFRDAVLKDFNHFKDVQDDFVRNLEEQRSLIQEQINKVSNIWTEHQVFSESLIQNMEELKRNFDEQRAKLSSLVFDVRAASQIASEAAERVEIQERELYELRKEVNQMKVDLEILDDLANTGCDTYNFSGKIIWKISDFESKLKRAKENDVVLKSPIFYTHPYGYKVRILLYLNGLKKWKDRYALACIHVLKGEYDMILPWPCYLDGWISFRDLKNILQPKSFKKSIKAKQNFGDEECEEPQESSSTYIFIPHNVLLKDIYLKNDTTFIEVKLHNPEKVETTL